MNAWFFPIPLSFGEISFQKFQKKKPQQKQQQQQQQKKKKKAHGLLL